MKTLANKVGLITGGASGIGKATAKLFCSYGAKVAIMDLNEEAGNNVVKEIRNEGGAIIFIKGDISKSADAKNAVDTTVKKFSGLDILVNNAATTGHGSVIHLKEEDWDRVMNVNLRGTFLMTKYAVPHLKKIKGSSIVNVTSVAGFQQPGIFVNPVYCTSKGGIIAFTKSLAFELSRYGIRVNAIAPGTVLTPMGKRALVFLPQMIASFPEEERKKLFLGRGVTEEDMKDMENLKNLPNEERMKQARKISNRILERFFLIGRAQEPEEMAAVIAFLASDAASAITGEVIVADGGASCW